MPNQYDDKPTKDLRSPGRLESGDDDSLPDSAMDNRKTIYSEPPTRLDFEDVAPIQQNNPKPRLPWPARDRRPRSSEMSSQKSTALREEPTRLFGNAAQPANSSKRSDFEEASGSHHENSRTQLAGDPVVGWLVVVEGPGKGRSLEIGVGANAIGRDQGQEISINFGDVEIHREKHAFVVYDPRSRAFFLQRGDSRNLTYINEKIVLESIELKGGETILVGRTHLRFVPLCGPDFSWV